MTAEALKIAAPFRLPPQLLAGFPRRLAHAVLSLCERILAFPALNAAYARTQADQPTLSFPERALRAVGVGTDFDLEGLTRIPKTGPLIVVANHPYGGLDGLILAALLQRVRPDARLLANFLLKNIPEMESTCLFVDPFGGPAAQARNRTSMKQAIRWVSEGGALGVFPAGEVSHFTWQRGCVTDPAWDDTIARLALRTQATVVPVFFSGRNSRLFQCLGLLHPRLRTAMLPRELLRLRGKSVRVEIGNAIAPGRLARFRTQGEGDSSKARAADSHVTEYLRLRTYILRGRSGERAEPPVRRDRARITNAAAMPIIAAHDPQSVAAEFEALPPEQVLVTSGALQVCYASSDQIPLALREVGRLRELTFRAVGEGTGRELDLDQFDQHYLHLLVWNPTDKRIIGGYRMGQTDVLLRRFGAAGLYTTTLFRYQARLLEQLTPALELGRSFVAADYQRDYTPLSLLWKGIGRFVVRHPRYRQLFGAVSISDEYQSMTKQLLMAFLTTHSFDAQRAALVRPRKPLRPQPFRDADPRRMATLVHDVADVEELVAEIESNRRSIPVLLRQYLKLNAHLLGFNIDPDFGDVVDGLVLIDLTKVARPILNRYLGPDGAAEFLAFHERASTH